MGVRFQLVIDCAEPEPLARFWAAALGYVLEPPPEGFATWDDYYRDLGLPESFLGHGTDCIIDPAGSGPRVWFQMVPDVKTVKNRLHLDLITDTFDAETGRLLSLGARRLRDVQGAGSSWTTFADIEGNEFDLIAG